MSAEDGIIRSAAEGEVFVPQQGGWHYYDHSYFHENNFDNCRTERFILLFIFTRSKESTISNSIYIMYLRKGLSNSFTFDTNFQVSIHSGLRCIFPFKYEGFTYSRCAPYAQVRGAIDVSKLL